MALFPLPSNIGRVKSVSGSGGTSVGLEIVDVVPAGKAWYLMAVTQLLHKGGAGGTPTPWLQLADPGGNVFWQTPGSSAGQALSTTTVYSWAPGQALSTQLGPNAGGTFMATAPLPAHLVLPAGYQILTSTYNTVGGTSSYGTQTYFVCELG